MTNEDIPTPIALADGSTLVPLHDGVFEPGAEVLIDPAGEAETAALRAAHPSGLRIDVNAFLLRRDGEAILIDAGAGNAWGPAFGGVARALAALGLAPGDIRTILLTHPHPDHALGLLDDGGTALRYPEAEVFCPALDIDHFGRPPAGGAEEPAPRAAVRRVFGLLGGRLRPVTPGEFLPGIEAISLPGHTPGHTGFLLGGLFLVWGDLVHVPDVQGPNPDLGLVFDEDPALARATRRQMLATAAEKQWRVAGMHLPDGGVARVETDGDGFRIVPERRPA